MTRGSIPRHCLTLAAALAAALPAVAAGKGGTDETVLIPVDEITAGMKGYGMTVFGGTEPERFDVEVISVLHDFLPRQDLILVRCSHPVLDHTGTIAGMSGSPVYLDGRLAGAVAYAWKFAKDPIAGVTPATSMAEYLDLPSLPAGVSPGGGKILAAPPPDDPEEKPASAFWERFEGPGAQMVPLATPVSGSGDLWSGFLAGLSGLLDTHFMIAAPPSPSVGKKKASKDAKGPVKAKFRPGDAIAVQLVGGDLDMAATGTVTMVKDGRALGFGHPMFNWGEVELPASTAIIQHCLASSAFSFKMSESADPAGAIVQDRQAGIMADMGADPRTAKLEVELHDAARGLDQSWRMDVAHHRQITASLVRSALTSAVDHFALEVVDTVASGLFRIEVDGHAPLEFEEKVFLPQGTLGLQYSQRLAEALDSIMRNQFEDARLRRVRVDLDLEYGHDVATIAGAYAEKDEVSEGEEIRVWVILKPHQGPKTTLWFDLVVPDGTAGRDINVTLQPGGRVPYETTPPDSLDDVLDNLSKGYSDELVGAVVQVPDVGLTVEGKAMGALPLSAIATLSPQAAYMGEEPLATLDRYFLATPYILEGNVSLQLRVKTKEGK